MLTEHKVIGADLAHIIEGNYSSTFVIPLGISTEQLIQAQMSPPKSVRSERKKSLGSFPITNYGARTVAH